MRVGPSGFSEYFEQASTCFDSIDPDLRHGVEALESKDQFCRIVFREAVIDFHRERRVQHVWTSEILHRGDIDVRSRVFPSGVDKSDLRLMIIGSGGYACILPREIAIQVHNSLDCSPNEGLSSSL